MRSRKKMRRRTDRKFFSKTASKVHSKNNRIVPMRGGIRI